MTEDNPGESPVVPYAYHQQYEALEKRAIKILGSYAKVLLCWGNTYRESEYRFSPERLERFRRKVEIMEHI